MSLATLLRLTNFGPKLLCYGVIVLGFLLAVLAFWLLQHKETTLKAAISFMVFAVVLVSLGLASEWIRHRQTPPPKPWYELSGAPKQCKDLPGWPAVGRWYLWGRFEDHTPTLH